MTAPVAQRVTVPRVQSAARPVATLALAGLVASGILICLRAAARASTLVPASWHGMPGWMSGPLPGLGHRLTTGTFSALFLAMCGFYLAALALGRSLDARVTVGAIVLMHVAFLLAPPLLSTDVFGYIAYARLGVLHGIEPYSNGPLAAAHDAAFTYFRWRRTVPSPYGPAFTLLSYAMAPLGVAGAFWALKAAAAAASLGCVALTAACARRLGADPLRAAALVGLNPLLLVWAVGGAHNDLLAVVAVLGGVWLVIAGRERAAGVTMILAAALKVSAGVVAPYAAIGTRRRGPALTAAAALAAVGFAVLTLIVFGDEAAGFITTNPDRMGWVATSSVPNQLGVLLGSGGITPAIRTLAFVVLAVVLVWTLVRTWRGADWIASAGWATLAVIVCSTWVMPWYATWLLPLAAIGRDRRLVAGTLLLCAYLVYVRTPF